MAKLIKVDRNGSKHYEGMVTCDRCNGTGIYVWGAIIDGSPQYAGVCYKCGGERKVLRKWIERTPEYQAKLDAKRAAKQATKEAEWKAAAEQARLVKEAEEAKIKAEEAKIKAEKAISQHVGHVGERITVKAVYDHTAWFEVNSFSGYGTETMYIHTFKDQNGNVLIWKTGRDIALTEGDSVKITGTVKEHSEYQDEKQTILTRCRIKAER